MEDIIQDYNQDNYNYYTSPCDCRDDKLNRLKVYYFNFPEFESGVIYDSTKLKILEILKRIKNRNLNFVPYFICDENLSIVETINNNQTNVIFILHHPIKTSYTLSINVNLLTLEVEITYLNSKEVIKLVDNEDGGVSILNTQSELDIIYKSVKLGENCVALYNNIYLLSTNYNINVDDFVYLDFLSLNLEKVLIVTLNPSLDIYTVTEKELFDNKVDKEPGKGLSTNDYTNEEKLLVNTIPDKVDKVIGKELSTNDYTNEDKSLVSTISNKVDKISGKGLSTNDYTNEAKSLVSTIPNKVNKESGKGLSTNDFTNELKTKLEELKLGSNVEVLQTIDELLSREDLRVPGQPVYVIETDLAYYYSSVKQTWDPYTNIVEQDTEPVNTDLIWIDSKEKSIPQYTNEDLHSINQAIVQIQETLSKYDFAFNSALASGDFTNSARLDMYKSATPEKPADAPESSREIELTDPDYPDYPSWADDMLPNLKHLSIKMGTYSNMIANKLNFINGELLWCYDTSQLYIMSKGSLIWINKGGGGSGGGGLDYDALDKLETIGFISPNGTYYRVKVNNDGKLIVYKKRLDSKQLEPTGGTTDSDGWVYVTYLYLQKLYINSLYCGGITSDEHSYNYCSHNFVELSNLTTEDISLNGLSLQYCNEGTSWEVLPLWGNIKSQSTFLIRGAQCSVINANTTRIKIDTYDLEWVDSNGKLIKFDNNKAKFYLTWGTDPSNVKSQYKKDPSGTIQVSKGYIDFVGFNKENAGAADVVDGSENAPYTYLSSNRLFTKYYAMDPVSQATKALSARNNANDWYFVDLTKDLVPSVEAFTPRASFENKDIFYNKSRFTSYKPNLINITFGIQATAPNATRCFNWTSIGYYDEYIWYKLKSNSNWIKVESFKNETGVRKYYNRIRMEATDKTAFTTHKVIIKNLSVGIYEYKIGRADKNGNPSEYISDTLEFTVRNSSSVSSFTFVQTSDQQGFNWDEYEVWKKSAEYIKEHVPDIQFTINTGDLTQNGNRLNEWIDYYNGRKSLDHVEELITVGNNDLCPTYLYELGNGGDSSKINSANVSLFYTFEIDEDNPPVFTLENKEVFINSLYSFNYGNAHFICVNSEISELTESLIYGLTTVKNTYTKIKEWCIRDITKNNSYKWNIAFCHEMPFTIITQNVIQNFYWNNVEYPEIERAGSRLNVNCVAADKYWFSKFCQEYNIRLVLGGHKHTYSESWPIKENFSPTGVPITMKPIIQVTLDDLQTYFDSSSLYEETTGSLAGQKFPEKWRTDNNYDQHKHLCTFELVTKITAPKYVMCQATGYKHTSNKELPAPNIPWLKNYFPAKVVVSSQEKITATVNAGQRYPFYIIWDITPTRITGTVKKISYIFNNSGKFNINISSSANPPEAVGGNGEANQGNDLIIIQ